MDKLIKQFQRDFKKNPKKVVLLGVLGVVCLWVMVPLFLPEEKKKPVNRASTAPVIKPNAVATSTAAAPVMRWEDLDRALNTDPRMQGVGKVAAVPTFPPPRNPFEVPFDVDAAMDELLTEIAGEMEAEEVVAVQATSIVSIPAAAQFDAVPLELASTIVGGAQAVAVINGRTFRTGDKIGTSYGREIVLESVAPRSAVVAWNGTTRTLRILSPREAASQSSLAGTRTTQ